MAYGYPDAYPNELRRLLESLGPGESLDPRELAAAMGPMGAPDMGDQPSRTQQSEQAAVADLVRRAQSGEFGDQPSRQPMARAEPVQPSLSELPTDELMDRYRPARGGFIRREDTGQTLFVNGREGGIGTSPDDANRASLEAMRQAALERFQKGQQQQHIKVAGYSNGGIMSDVGEMDGPAPTLDYTRGPVDTPKGRGYYGKDGAVYVKTPEGVTKVLLGYDRDASYVANKRNVDMQQSRLNLDKTQADIEHQQEVNAGLRAAREVKEDPFTQASLEKRYGKAEKGYQWTPDGRQVPAAGGQKAEDAKDVLELLKQAEPLIDKSTGSYTGAVVDKVQQVFGASNEGADAAAKLRALQGALIAKMPKMSGPQSDKDVQLYREMAGEIGDPTIPAARKRAAMETIRQINERHATGSAAAQPTMPAAPASNIPQGAIDHLKANPGMRTAFDMKYGRGAAARVLGN